MAIKVTNDNAKSFRMHFHKGVILRRMANSNKHDLQTAKEMIEQSIISLKTAVAQNPSDPTFLNNLGLSYFENEEYDEAINNY